MNYIAQQTCHYSFWLNHAPLERQVTVSKELLARWRGEKGVTVSNLGSLGLRRTCCRCQRQGESEGDGALLHEIVSLHPRAAVESGSCPVASQALGLTSGILSIPLHARHRVFTQSREACSQAVEAAALRRPPPEEEQGNLKRPGVSL